VIKSTYKIKIFVGNPEGKSDLKKSDNITGKKQSHYRPGGAQKFPGS